MRIYLFDEGLARFATEPYEAPKQQNLNDVFMHLTNYAINKQNDNYEANECEDGSGGGHKRSLTQIWIDIVNQERRKKPKDRSVYMEAVSKVNVLKEKIKDIIIKTLITGQPSIWHLYRSCQPEDYENQLCFQLLGFDIMLDSEMKPWLLEVNHAPSLATDSGFDLALKQRLVEDILKLLNLDIKKKNQYINQHKK